MTYVVRARETGDWIDECITMEDAERVLEQYEDSDRNEGTFEDRFYEIVEEDVRWVWVQEGKKRIENIDVTECKTRKDAVRCARDKWNHLTAEERRSHVVYAGLMDMISGDVRDIVWSSEEVEYW